MDNAADFLLAIFGKCNGIPVTANAEEGFQSRRWVCGSVPPSGATYFCISTVKDIPRVRVLQRRTEDLVETCVVVLDDIGTKISLELAATFPAPSWKLESSPGNFQWGYLFKRGVEPARAAALIEALANAGYTDKGSKRADRIMRIPGSLNTKYAEPWLARLTEWYPERRWSLAELALAFKVTPTDVPTQALGAPASLEPGETDPKFEWQLAHGRVRSGPNPRGWYSVVCPLEGEHTGDVEHGTDYLPGKPGVFKCLHSHGDRLTTAWFTDWILEQDPKADLGLIPREQLEAVGKKLGAALGLPMPATPMSATPMSATPRPPPKNDGAGTEADHAPSENSSLAQLWATLQEQAAAGTMFAPAPVDTSSLSPAQALAAILREIYLDPCLLPDCDTTAGGKVSQAQTTTAPRVHTVMDLIGMKARWNVMSGKVESSFDAAPGYVELVDKTDGGVDSLVHACARCGMKNAQAIVQALANRALGTPYSPVCEWISSAPWDGVSRLEALYRTITMQDQTPEAEQWKRAVIKRWLIQGAAAMWNWKLDAAAVDVGYMLILQGETGLGKSKWIERLLPVPWVSIGKSIKFDHGSERDAVSRVTQTPITEIGELDGSFAKSADAALKNFLTTTIDVYRPPYGRRDISRPRCTVFAASVNPEGFLKDVTGERRYWPLAVEKVDYLAVEQLDRQQLWAEVKARRDAGEQYWLDPAEMKLHQKFAASHRLETDVSIAIADLVHRRAVFPDEAKWVHANAKQLARHYEIKGYTSTYSDLNSSLSRAGFRRWNKEEGRGWRVPPYQQQLTPAQQAGFQVILGSPSKLKKE